MLLEIVMEKSSKASGFELNFHVAEKDHQDLRMALDQALDQTHLNDAQNFVSKSLVYHRQVAGKI